MQHVFIKKNPKIIIMKHYQFYILWLFVCVIAFYSCSKDEDIFLGNDEIEKPEGPGQPDNIVISLVASGVQDIIDIIRLPRTFRLRYLRN